MNKLYNFFLVSDSTGETLDRIFLAIKAQFPKFNYKIHHFAFMRTSAQTAQLIEKCKEAENPIILYTLVEKQTTNHIISECKSKSIPCFGILDHIIPDFVHIMVKGKIVGSGGPELAKVVEKEGYKRFIDEN